MIIRFSEFKTTLVFDTTKFEGSEEDILSYILKECFCRLPYDSINHKQICKLKEQIRNAYQEFKEQELAA